MRLKCICHTYSLTRLGFFFSKFGGSKLYPCLIYVQIYLIISATEQFFYPTHFYGTAMTILWLPSQRARSPGVEPLRMSYFHGQPHSQLATRERRHIVQHFPWFLNYSRSWTRLLLSLVYTCLACKKNTRVLAFLSPWWLRFCNSFYIPSAKLLQSPCL